MSHKQTEQKHDHFLHLGITYSEIISKIRLIIRQTFTHMSFCCAQKNIDTVFTGLNTFNKLKSHVFSWQGIAIKTKDIFISSALSLVPFFRSRVPQGNFDGSNKHFAQRQTVLLKFKGKVRRYNVEIFKNISGMMIAIIIVCQNDLLLFISIHFECGIYNLTYTKIKSMERSLIGESSLVSEDSAYFLCTCGAEFMLLQHYERHLREDHHPSTIIRQDVLEKKQDPPSRITQPTQSILSNLSAEEQLINRSAKRCNKNSNHQMRSKEERRNSIKTLSLARSIKISCDNNEEKVTWKGFKLLKNEYCNDGPYYCGKCEEVFLKINDYIIHCIQECQTIIHQNSSHTITLDLDKELLKKQVLKEEDAEVDSDIQDQQTEKQQQQQSFQTLINRLFKPIIKDKQDHRKFPFYCGQCKLNMSKSVYYKHITADHSQKMHKNSSHIVVKCFSKTYTILLYLSQNVPWINQEKEYFCLCNPKQKFIMRDFIRHIKKMHGGVSPLYILSRSKVMNFKIIEALNPQKQKLKNKQKKQLLYKSLIRQQQFEKALNFRNIYDILLKMQDHRNMPFACGICLTTFEGPGYYKIHLNNHCKNKQSFTSSHVILHIQNGKRRQNIYICPNIKWHHDYPIYFCPCSIDKKVSMNHLLQHIISEHYGISPSYSQQAWIDRKRIIKNQKYIENQMHKLQRYAKDHKDIVKFRCYPCNLQIINSFHYKNHIKYVHNNVIHPQSSHIIFQFTRCHIRDKQRLFISPHIKWAVAEHSDYFCSCQPARKIPMDVLIQHIIEIHHGITPVYCFDNYLEQKQELILRPNRRRQRPCWKKSEQMFSDSQ